MSGGLGDGRRSGDSPVSTMVGHHRIGAPEGTVKSRVRRGLANLHRELADR